MKEPCILIALKLLSYRETIAEVVSVTAPGARVLLTEPEHLDGQVGTLHPRLVICSKVTPIVEQAAPFWIEMYRDHGSLSTMKTPERRWEIANLELSDLTGMLSLL